MTRLKKAFWHSASGLLQTYKSEAAFRLEVFGIPIVGGVLWFVPLTGIECALIILSYGLVLVAELLNTAIEKTVDRISKDRHPLAKFSKDAGSAAVFLAIIMCGLIWICILIPKI